MKTALLSCQPLPESMVARLCESKKVCGAADTQLQVPHRCDCTHMERLLSSPGSSGMKDLVPTSSRVVFLLGLSNV